MIATARCVLVSTLALLLLLHSGQGQAQGIEPPPMADTKSPTGVSYDTGTFSLSSTDLSIGSGDPIGGLTFDRQYNSSLSIAFSSGFKAQGWTHNLHISISVKRIKTPQTLPPGREPYLYSVAFGDRSVGFVGGSDDPTGGLVGTYAPVLQGGEKLVYAGTEQSGTFTFTDKDGTVIVLDKNKAISWMSPNGVILTYNYNSNGLLKSIFSNLGFAILFDGESRWSKSCAINLSKIYVTAQSDCPSGAESVSYIYSGDGQIASVVDTLNQTTQYEYIDGGTARHLSCIKPPGQISCQISNQYNVCRRDLGLTQDPPNLREMDQVVYQTTATGESYSYSFQANPICPRTALNGGATMTAADGSTTTVITNRTGLPISTKNSLNHQITTTYDSAMYYLNFVSPETITYQEGNILEFQRDLRKNIVTRRSITKPGTQLVDLIANAAYPNTCNNAVTCNKPTSITDARGATTTYTYDAVHGGVLTEVGAAVGGVSPAKKYSYAQRYAWLKAAGAGYVQAATPVWVKTEERSCRTSALDLSTGACAAGSGDLALTAYEYQAGNASTPSNVWLTGVAVTADGQTQRACYGYDRDGNKTWETKPKAGLAACF